MDSVEVLLKAREIVAQGWCQHAYARMSSGTAADNLTQASCFCILGALGKATSFKDTTAAARANVLVQKHLGVVSLSAWNDDPGRTQMDVVLALERTAAKEMGLLPCP